MPPDTETSVVMVFLGIFCVAGTIGNSLVLYIYSRKRDKTTSTIFILTLAVTDFFTCLVIIPYTIATLYVEYRLQFDNVCRLYMFLITSNVPFSAFIMVAIAFDRYFCICHPFSHVFNIPRAKVIVALMAMFAGILGLLTALQHKIIITEAVTNNNTNITNGISDLHNDTGIIGIPEVDVTIDQSIIGGCDITTDLFGDEFHYIYHKLYSALYLLSFIIVLILYGLIYRVIHVRRAMKAKRKRSSLFPVASAELSMAETQMTVVNGDDQQDQNSNDTEQNSSPEQRVIKRKSPGLKERNFYANIRTAGMLFIVTIVYLLAFLPAWLMAHRVVPFSVFVFYMYFIYNVVNPVIYAFMNQSFRTDLNTLFCK